MAKDYEAIWNKEKLEHQRVYDSPEKRRMDLERIAISLMTGDGEDSGACFLEVNPIEIIDYNPEDWDEYELRNGLTRGGDIPAEFQEEFDEDDNYIWFQFTPELFDELSDCIKKYDKDFVCPVEKVGNFFVRVSTQRITFDDWLFRVFNMATCVGDFIMLRHLLENKHDMYVHDYEEESYAIDGMFRTQGKEMLDLFLEYGFDVNFANGHSLKIARESNNQEMIDALVSSGAVEPKPEQSFEDIIQIYSDAYFKLEKIEDESVKKEYSHKFVQMMRFMMNKGNMSFAVLEHGSPESILRIAHRNMLEYFDMVAFDVPEEESEKDTKMFMKFCSMIICFVNKARAKNSQQEKE